MSGDPLLSLQRLDARTIDCAILPLPVDSALYSVQQIAQSPLTVCMRSDDLLADRAQLAIHEIAQRITIFRDPELHPSAHSRLVEMFKEVGIAVHLACVARTSTEIQWMVKERQAIMRRVSVGKHVLLADIKQENAVAAAKVLFDAGFNVSTATVDVYSRPSVQALAEAATKLGQVSGVIHAAGVSPSQAHLLPMSVGRIWAIVARFRPDERRNGIDFTHSTDSSP